MRERVVAMLANVDDGARQALAAAARHGSCRSRCRGRCKRAPPSPRSTSRRRCRCSRGRATAASARAAIAILVADGVDGDAREALHAGARRRGRRAALRRRAPRARSQTEAGRADRGRGDVRDHAVGALRRGGGARRQARRRRRSATSATRSSSSRTSTATASRFSRWATAPTWSRTPACRPMLASGRARSGHADRPAARQPPTCFRRSSRRSPGTVTTNGRAIRRRYEPTTRSSSTRDQIVHAHRLDEVAVEAGVARRAGDRFGWP